MTDFEVYPLRSLIADLDGVCLLGGGREVRFGLVSKVFLFLFWFVKDEAAGRENLGSGLGLSCLKSTIDITGIGRGLPYYVVLLKLQIIEPVLVSNMRCS